MEKLRVGLVGLGAMGQNHLRVLMRLPGVEVVGVADSRIAALDVPPRVSALPDLDALLALGLDYCVVASPTGTHLQLAVTLASARVPTLIEKPLARTVEEASEIMKHFDNAGVVAGVGHIERFNPAVREARKKIEDGVVGEIYQVSTRRQSPFPSRVSDVGVTLDLATHDFDITSWLTGSQFSEVSARLTQRANRDHEDLISVVGTLENGTIVSHLVNWLAPFKERSITVHGQRGALVVNTLMSDLEFHANGEASSQWEVLAGLRGSSEGDMIRYSIAKPEPLRLEHENFRDAVAGRHGDIVTLSEGLDAIRVSTAVLRSAQEHSTVFL